MRKVSLAEIVLFIVFGLTALIWVRVVEFRGFTFASYHFATAALIIFVLISTYYFRSGWVVFRASAPIWLASMLLILVTFVSYATGSKDFGLREVLRPLFYTAGGLCAASIVYGVIRSRPTNALALAGLATIAIFLAFTHLALRAEHVDSLALVMRAIATGDPNVILYDLFGTLFRESGYVGQDEALANLRHEIFFMLLVSAVLSLSMVRNQTRSRRMLVYAAAAFIGFLCLISLSRSVWLAIFSIAMATGFLFVVKTRGGGLYLALLTPFAAVASFVVLRSPFLSLFANRLNEETSYDERIFASSYRLSEIYQNPVFPQIPAGMGWAHNILIDYWSASGILGIIAALLYVGAFAWLAIAHAVNYLGTKDPQMAAMSLAGLALILIPSTRIFTCPIGQLFLAGQLAVGCSAALFTACRVARWQAGRSASQTVPLRLSFR